jgi:serine/threonine protein kinase
MRHGRLPTELSRLKMLRGAAAGVLHMHRKGILHRDIRRANVLLDSGDKALLADLGLARFVRQDAKAEYTQQGSPVPARWTAPVISGAPHGCSQPTPSAHFLARHPQETLVRGKSSFASDVYMFGAFMFETLAGSKPFADVSQIDRVEELVKAGTKPVRPPDALGSAAAWALVDKCMAFEEAARPALDDVIRELDKLIAAIPQATGPVSVLDVLLTRPYAAKVNRDLASITTWAGLAEILGGDPDDARELVAVEGKVALRSVVGDLNSLLREYGPKA